MQCLEIMHIKYFAKAVTPYKRVDRSQEKDLPSFSCFLTPLPLVPLWQSLAASQLASKPQKISLLAPSPGSTEQNVKVQDSEAIGKQPAQYLQE